MSMKRMALQHFFLFLFFYDIEIMKYFARPVEAESAAVSTETIDEGNRFPLFEIVTKKKHKKKGNNNSNGGRVPIESRMLDASPGR